MAGRLRSVLFYAEVIIGGLNQVVVSFEGNSVSILGDDVKRTQHIQRVVNSPLHILEVKFLTIYQPILLPCFSGDRSQEYD